jgi:hypothetical protein
MTITTSETSASAQRWVLSTDPSAASSSQVARAPRRFWLALPPPNVHWMKISRVKLIVRVAVCNCNVIRLCACHPPPSSSAYCACWCVSRSLRQTNVNCTQLVNERSLKRTSQHRCPFQADLRHHRLTALSASPEPTQPRTQYKLCPLGRSLYMSCLGLLPGRGGEPCGSGGTLHRGGSRGGNPPRPSLGRQGRDLVFWPHGLSS